MFLTKNIFCYRERGLRRLREELRAEEMKLVLLKKLKQSQQLKENVAVLTPSIPASALPPTGLPSGLSITPTTVKVPAPSKISPANPQVAHSRHPISSNSNSMKVGVISVSGGCNVPNLMRTVSFFNFYYKFSNTILICNSVTISTDLIFYFILLLFIFSSLFYKLSYYVQISQISYFKKKIISYCLLIRLELKF